MRRAGKQKKPAIEIAGFVDFTSSLPEQLSYTECEERVGNEVQDFLTRAESQDQCIARSDQNSRRWIIDCVRQIHFNRNLLIPRQASQNNQLRWRNRRASRAKDARTALPDTGTESGP